MHIKLKSIKVHVLTHFYYTNCLQLSQQLMFLALSYPAVQVKIQTTPPVSVQRYLIRAPPVTVPRCSAANGVNAEDKIKLPARGKGKLPVPPRKRVTLDDINELHFSVLQKENKKLDIEIDNLLLKKREILLRIQELEARTINPELNLLSH